MAISSEVESPPDGSLLNRIEACQGQDEDGKDKVGDLDLRGDEVIWGGRENIKFIGYCRTTDLCNDRSNKVWQAEEEGDRGRRRKEDKPDEEEDD